MPRPDVIVNITNNNLGIKAPNALGNSIILVACRAAPVAGYGVVFTIKSKAQARTAFAQVDNANVLDAIVDGLYAHAADGTTFWVIATAPTTTLAVMLGAVAEKALIVADGGARMLAVIKHPPVGYVQTTTDGFDQDVHDAVAAAQLLAENWQVKNKGFRYFIQGFGYTGQHLQTKDYSTASNRNGGIVVGDINGSSMLLTMLALGKAASLPPRRNIGRVKDGSLNIAESASVAMGGTLIDGISPDVLNTLHDRRYITLERNQIASGYIFTDDPCLCASTDDYNNFRYGRVIDEGQRIAYVAYYEELKDDVNVDEDGRLDKVVERALEKKVEEAIQSGMGTELSTKRDGTPDVVCLVNPDKNAWAGLYLKNDIDNPDFNLIENGGLVYLFLFLRPKGSLNQLSVYLGLTASSIQ